MALGALKVSSLRGCRLIVAATLILSVTALASASRAEDVPGGWERNDYIAYLVLSDLLLKMTEKSDDMFVACIANDIGTKHDGHQDPSLHLMSALNSEFAENGRKMPLRPASQCREASGRIEEMSTGKAAIWVFVSGGPGGDSYMAAWHLAPLLGGGTRYQLVPGKQPLEVTPAGLGFVE